MVIRTYFDKNNTIIKNSDINTGKNPVAELYYGTDNSGNQVYTRFLFHFSLTEIKEYFAGVSPDIQKHVLKMTNTGVFHNDLLNTTTGDGKQRTSSFKLRLFKVNQPWDEGTGYDFFVAKDGTYSRSASNFKLATSSTPWDEFTFLPDYTQSFDAGNENLELDITQLILNEPGDTLSLGIAFEEVLETKDTDGLQYVGFFTRHTNTFYKPYVESRTLESIKDDRKEFYAGKDNNLYFFNMVDGKPTSLEGALPKVDIKFGGSIIPEYTQESKMVRQGVYKITLNIPDAKVNEVYFDSWYQLDVDGVTRKELGQMMVVINEPQNDVHRGGFSMEPKQYRIDVSGIKINERIKRGDVRQIFVHPTIPYSVKIKETSVNKMQYRLYVKEGENEHDVISFQDVDMTYYKNYFLLDTKSLLPNTYYLDIKSYSNMDVKTSAGVLKFDIVK